MPIAASRLTVTDAPVEIANGRQARDWVIDNRGANPIFVGPAGVTAAGGFQVDAGGSIALTMESRDRTFAVCATGLTTTLHRLAQ